jgi:HNH endonuclease
MPYTKEWPNIRARIQQRADDRCERCGVGRGETYNRRSGRVVSEKEFIQLGKQATRTRKQRLKGHEKNARRAKERFLSPFISEAAMAGDYENGYFAEGGYYPIDNEPAASELIFDRNNNVADRFEVHHVDHDKTNNVDSNLEYLCKRCHMFKHKD